MLLKKHDDASVTVQQIGRNGCWLHSPGSVDLTHPKSKKIKY